MEEFNIGEAHMKHSRSWSVQVMGTRAIKYPSDWTAEDSL